MLQAHPGSTVPPPSRYPEGYQCTHRPSLLLVMDISSQDDLHEKDSFGPATHRIYIYIPMSLARGEAGQGKDYMKFTKIAPDSERIHSYSKAIRRIRLCFRPRRSKKTNSATLLRTFKCRICTLDVKLRFVEAEASGSSKWLSAKSHLVKYQIQTKPFS